MKYALTLLFILALGLFASQAIKLDPVHGYDANLKDQILLQNVYQKIDQIKIKNPPKLERIEKKLPALFLLFKPQSQESYILHEIYKYIQSVNKSVFTSHQESIFKSSKNPRSDEMIMAIGEEIR